MEENLKKTTYRAVKFLLPPIIIALAGCKPNGNVEVNASASEPPTRQVATASQWRQSISQAFDFVDKDKLRDKKNPEYVKVELGPPDDNGESSFFACFESGPPVCKLLTHGSRDVFRKLHFFEDVDLSIAEIMADLIRNVSQHAT